MLSTGLANKFRDEPNHIDGTSTLIYGKLRPHLQSCVIGQTSQWESNVGPFETRSYGPLLK